MNDVQEDRHEDDARCSGRLQAASSHLDAASTPDRTKLVVIRALPLCISGRDNQSTALVAAWLQCAVVIRRVREMI